MTEATQAPLPVTQADRDAAADLALVLAMEMTAHITRKGKHGADQQPLTQAFARHRISHSLPGAGMRETLSNACDFIEAMIDANDYVGTGSGAAGKLEEREDRESLAEFRAALTPSPCPGDGMQSALGEELAALWAAVTAGDLSTAERHTESELVECPMCREGSIEAADYCNIDAKALGVQFYGIGPEHGAHERLWTAVIANFPAILAALTPSVLSPEPVQKVHELPEGHRWCRHCEQKDPHCSVCEGVGYLPSALSGDAGEGGLREENKRLVSHIVRVVLERDRLRDAGRTVLDGLDRRIEASSLTEPCPVFEGIVELRDAITAASHQGAE